MAYQHLQKGCQLNPKGWWIFPPFFSNHFGTQGAGRSFHWLIHDCVFSYPPVNKHSNGTSPSWIGNTSSNGGFSIAMLDYRSVIINGLPSQSPPPCKTFTQLAQFTPSLDSPSPFVSSSSRKNLQKFMNPQMCFTTQETYLLSSKILEQPVYWLHSQKKTQHIKPSFLSPTELPVWSQQKHRKTTTDFSPRWDLKILKSFQQGETSGLNMRASRRSILQLVII